jgi:hypothetical protein
LATAPAQGCGSDAPTTTSQFIGQVQNKPGTGSTYRMTKSNRAPIYIHVLSVSSSAFRGQNPTGNNRNRRESFIYLE